MPHRILGLHHVTATVDDAQADIDFCVDALGLRLVKKTVNFDNHSVYHFYYGDERGTPGTIWTTFPYRYKGVRGGTHGAGQVTATSFSVPQPSLGFWSDRLRQKGFETRPLAPRFGEEGVAVSDPSGLRFELVATVADARAPWAGTDVSGEHAVRGFHSVTLTVRNPEPTLEFMAARLGFQPDQQGDGRTRVVVGGRGPGHQVDVHAVPDAPSGVNGLGTVHHVAFAIGTPEEQLRLREELLGHGVRVTPVMDRCYFQSIYFREPGGVLFEVATISPGFTADEPLAELGRGLKLPPWEEANRAVIEATLPPVSVPLAGGEGGARR